MCLVAGMVLFPSVAIAQDASLCTGDVIVAFPDARLLNVEGFETAGPFEVVLEPGTYLVTAASFDAHGGDQITQPKEQWQLIGDSGWSSPFTVDIPDERQTTVSTFNSQVIDGGLTSVIVSHRGEGEINSVTPVCAGFTKLESVPTTTESVPTTTESVPTTTESVPTTTDPDDDADGSTDGATRDPDEDSGDPDDDGDGSTAGTDRDPEAAVTTTTAAPTPTTAAPAPVAPTTPPTDIEPEVEGAVETPGTLARTGPDPVTVRILGLGFVLVGLGGLSMLANRRIELPY